MNPEELMSAACAETGLDDFGAGSFREGLEVYCDSVSAEAQLNEVGEAAVTANVSANLAARLRVVDWARRHPEVSTAPIERPLIVIGMFRAGTTLLSHLLDQDPANRCLLRWEAADPVPPPRPAALRTGPRVEAARTAVAMLESLNPKMAVAHHEDADGPTECVAIMSQDFKSWAYEAITNVPSYSRWLLGVDQRSAYEHHRLVLRVLQSGGARGRWTLKSPHHAIALEALTSVYPDARLVLLHRDPMVLCGSVCSLISTLTGTFSDGDHRRYIAAHWPAMLHEAVERVDEFRAAQPEHEILDVQYRDLTRAPVDTVARIYEHFGDTLDDGARDAIAAYASSHPRGKLGEHRYDLADYGLNRAEIAERFRGYVARYDVPAEA